MSKKNELDEIFYGREEPGALSEKKPGRDSRSVTLLPRIEELLSLLGERVKLARKRRKLSLSSVAERSQISRPTLISIEHGAPTVSIGAYLSVLFILGLEEDINKLADDDTLGRNLQDIALKKGKRKGGGRGKKD